MGKSSWKKLSDWFERQKRVLPWRNDPSVYRVWISEIMLQQTQVTTVVPYFDRFLARFSDVKALADASEEEVLLYWAGLGYYSRARNLRKAAQQIVAQGRFPQSRKEWEAIPGVGPYTAGAILSIALNQPEAILDGNVERVLSRFRKVGREAGDTEFKNRLWELSRLYVSQAHDEKIPPSRFNQALMELGAMICVPRHPKCEVCPLVEECHAHASRQVSDFPPKKKRKEWIEIHEELHCLLDQRGRVFLRRRAPGEWRAGLWDFLDSKPKSAVQIGSVESRHVVTRHKIMRVTQLWKQVGAPLREKEDRRWITISEPEVPVGSALRKVLDQMVEKFPRIVVLFFILFLFSPTQGNSAENGRCASLFTFQTERLRAGPLEESDQAQWIQVWSRPEMKSYYDLESAQVMGTFVVHYFPSSRSASIGYSIVPEYQFR